MQPRNIPNYGSEFFLKFSHVIFHVNSKNHRILTNSC